MHDSKSPKWDLIIVAEYGARRNQDILPSVTKMGVEVALSFLNSGVAREIAWGCTDNAGPGSKDNQ